MVDDCVVQAVQAEIQQPRKYRFAPFGDQEIFQMVVAKRGELYINLADNANLFLFDRTVQTDLFKRAEDKMIQFFYLPVQNYTVSGKTPGNDVHADLNRLVA